MLRVDDALQQVLDFLKLSDDAKALLEVGEAAFEWRLEWASTNSPFTLSAIAEPVGAELPDVVEYAEGIKLRVSGALQDCASGLPPPRWLSPHSARALVSLFRRNANGLASTLIDFDGTAPAIEIDRALAEKVVPTLEIEMVHLLQEVEIPVRYAYGELDGRIVSAGRYRNRPAFQLETMLYGLVWCVLSPELAERCGVLQSLADVWHGKPLVVLGRLSYAKGGQKVARMDVDEIREKEVPSVKIEDVLDPEFTAGLDPVDYLNRLHGGDLG
jgi:hypothetical protein